MLQRVYKLKFGEPSMRIARKINTVVNKFKDMTEVVFYKKDFEVKSGSLEYYCVQTDTGEIKNERLRKFIQDGDTLKPLNDSVKIKDFKRSLYESGRRAKDNFYAYGLCNHWKYFCTFTVSVNEWDYDDQAIKKYWKLCKKKLQYKFPSMKILAVPERHTKNKTNLHFHALIGNCNLEEYLSLSRNPHNNKPILQNDRQVYNLNIKFWNKGFNTVVKIEDNAQLQIVNYMLKYLTKNGNIGYNQKKYYRTNNLEFKNKLLEFNNLKEFLIDVRLDRFQIHKENNKMIVFRMYHK